MISMNCIINESPWLGVFNRGGEDLQLMVKTIFQIQFCHNLSQKIQRKDSMHNCSLLGIFMKKFKHLFQQSKTKQVCYYFC